MGDKSRLPPGQRQVNPWPVLDLGIRPEIPLDQWTLRVDGAVDTPLSWDWEQFMSLPQTRLTTDMHCVTTWSRYDNDWDGVRCRDLLALVQPQLSARFVLLSSADGYTTNLPLDYFMAEDSLLVHHWQGEPLTAIHGGPVRALVPQLYLWKSAKWLTKITLLNDDQAGYWEQRGYHMLGDPWREQRFS